MNTLNTANASGAVVDDRDEALKTDWQQVTIRHFAFGDEPRVRVAPSYKDFPGVSRKDPQGPLQALVCAK